MLFSQGLSGGTLTLGGGMGSLSALGPAFGRGPSPRGMNGGPVEVSIIYGMILQMNHILRKPASRFSNQTRMQSDLGLHFFQSLSVQNFVSLPYEPRREKTGFLHMRKQRRRSASR